MSSVDCSLCNFKSPSRSCWLSHLRSVHSEDNDFLVTCNIDGCNASYSKCASLVSHIYRKHRDCVVNGESSEIALRSEKSGEYNVVDNYEDLAASNLLDNGASDISGINFHHTIDQLLGIDDEEQVKKSALFILNLKEIKGLSQAAVDHIVKETQQLFNHTFGRLKAGVDDRLSRRTTDFDESILNNISDLFENVKDPFQGLNSVFRQENYYRNQLGCLDPVEVKIGAAYYATRFSGSKRRKVLINDTFQYIPIEMTLKKLLVLQDVRAEIENFHGSSDTILKDICDGSIFKLHPCFSSDNKAIQIIAYFDEIELCNPLGCSSKIHKVGCIFFTIGNFRPQFRSNLKSIFLVTVANSMIIRKHGIDSVLIPFVNSLKKLSQDGLTVSIGGNDTHYKVACISMLADNLGAHAIGGFKESMSFARRICRSCMATTEMIQEHFLEADFDLRTPQTHQLQVEELTGSNRLSKSIEYGINRRSILDDIPYFSVVRNIPHDIMHDLFEGIVPYEMKLLLNQLIENKYCTVPILNARICSFDFGYSELSDKPSLLDERVLKSADQKIRQSATKMWSLAVYLPLLIGDLVPAGCKVWDLFIILLKICSIAASWQIKSGTISYLQVLIEEHHTQFKELYPDKAFIPKMHYMVHYPRQIMLHGPLVYSWTMRHEAKLSVMKRSSSHGNFKNICYTIAKRSMHELCYHLNCPGPFLSRQWEISSTKTQVLLNDESQELRNYIAELNVIVHHPKWAKLGPMFLKKFAYVFLGIHGLYPKFGKISDLFVLLPNNSSGSIQYAVRLQECITQYYDSHFGAYVVELSSNFKVNNLSSIPFFPVLHSHRSFNHSRIYVVLKQFVN